ncbi:uncharacterized protein [Neodiprion pinetum]|uniref:Uncharacterized protein LOC107220717 n=1 Tax=Neodiprion lecontei TaxID=441921 RepID=A0ABM3G9M9_NEOLC|nr:uncharacterized protein LOC124219383 [Neodiprion pinetum]XP_046596950.1 uncharacterized protein LOC107220717 [Neodiprion lecontei]XP_046596951.1 uncharacterized protein LOC107220717 [Neodiprion lecontei]
MIKITIILLVSCNCIAASLAAPTTYDQRQDGDINLAAKLENILILIATPSSSTSPTEGTSDRLETYLTMLNSRDRTGFTHLKNTGSINVADILPALNARQDLPRKNLEISLSSAEDQQEQEAGSATAVIVQTLKQRDPSAAKARSLQWKNVAADLLIHDKPEESLKQEISRRSLDRNLETGNFDNGGQSRSGDHNEVGLVADHRLTLIGTAIEDCGPYRRRNSYGICQPFFD